MPHSSALRLAACLAVISPFVARAGAWSARSTLEWRFSGSLGLGLDSANGESIGSLEVSVGHDVVENFSLEAVLGYFAHGETLFGSLGVRPLYVLSEHFDIGGIAALGLGEATGVLGPHLGFQDGPFSIFYEPLVAFGSNGRDPFDEHTSNGTGVMLVPLRFGIGARF